MKTLSAFLLCVFSGVALSTAGCRDDDSKKSPLDPNVPPVTQGNWYRPSASTTWQWQLTGAVNTGYDVDVYDIDLFDSDTALIESLQASGKRVICYFSCGSSEDWRPDFDEFEDDDMGGPLDEWEGERWLDIRSANVHRIMLERLDLAVTKGCDGVEPDNMDGYVNDTEFSLSSNDQLGFNRFIANAAHERNLAVGLKNDGGQVPQLVDYFDFELNEECHDYDECDELHPFVASDKPIFNAEYENTEAAATTLATTLCPTAVTENIRTLIMPLDLDDEFRVSCDDL